MNKNRKKYIIFTLIICLFSFLIVDKALYNDTFSAIAIGKYILNHGIDFQEHFNIDNNLIYHNSRYLFNILVTLIYNYFGFTGIYIFVIIITSLIGITLFNILLKINKNINVSFMITLFILFISKFFFNARAQIISYLLLILEIYFIEMLLKSNKKRYILYLVITSILIANIHTTIWPMTLILFLPYFGENIIEKFGILEKNNQLYTNTINIKLLFICFIIIILSGLITPLGLTPYTYMFKTMGGFSKEIIDELKISNIFIIYGMFIYTIILIYLLVYKKVKLKVSDLLLILGLYIMSILSMRNLSFFYMLCYISFSRIVMEYITNNKKIEKNKNIILLLFISFMISFSLGTYIFNVRHNFVDKTKYPVDASKYILKNIDVDNMRLYNHFNFGSYLEYKGIKTFIDSRSEIYCKEFNNTNILKHWYLVSSGQLNYNFVFSRYNITHVLLYNNEIINTYIVTDKRFKLIYKDDYFSLYEIIKD